MPLVLAAGVLVEDCLSSSGPHAPFKTFQGFFFVSASASSYFEIYIASQKPSYL